MGKGKAVLSLSGREERNMLKIEKEEYQSRKGRGENKERWEGGGSRESKIYLIMSFLSISLLSSHSGTHSN